VRKAKEFSRNALIRTLKLDEVNQMLIDTEIRWRAMPTQVIFDIHTGRANAVILHLIENHPAFEAPLSLTDVPTIGDIAQLVYRLFGGLCLGEPP
jgi:hypothetical protein